VKALLKRGQPAAIDPVLRVGDIEIDSIRHRATRQGRRIDLTAKEFALLSLLAQRTGEVLSRTQIASLVWDIHFDSDSNVVEVAIRRLRAKIDDPFPDKLIHTVRGVGYVLESRPPP
jgi:two-component system copper resistance phosphate regulon response regulator CusR